MALVRPSSIQKHPLAWGLAWAATAFALFSLIQYERGEGLPNLLISLPIWTVAGAVFGYSMKWFFDRKARQQ